MRSIAGPAERRAARGRAATAAAVPPPFGLAGAGRGGATWGSRSTAILRTGGGISGSIRPGRLLAAAQNCRAANTRRRAAGSRGFVSRVTIAFSTSTIASSTNAAAYALCGALPSPAGEYPYT